MKIQDGDEILKPFRDKCTEDKDPYMVVHFSREEDRFRGYEQGMDQGDALIVINYLIKEFNLSPESIASMEPVDIPKE